MPGEGPPWVAHGPTGPGGPWSATAQNFFQHQFSHVTNVCQERTTAALSLESRSDGQAQLSLTFQLPSPSEIIPPPVLNHPLASGPSLRPIIPLFPAGDSPHPKPKQPTERLSFRQHKSYQRAVFHRTPHAATTLPPSPHLQAHCAGCGHSCCSSTLSTTQASKNRLRSSSPITLSHLQEYLSLADYRPQSVQPSHTEPHP